MKTIDPQPRSSLAISLAPSLAPSLSTSPLDTSLIFGHGLFQRMVMLCSMLSIFASLSHTLAIVVLARPVEHWCRLPPKFADTPTDVWKNQSIPVEADGTLSRCTRYEPPLDPGNMTGNRTVVFCSAWEYNLTTSGESIVSQWNLVCNRSWLLLLEPAIYLVGAIPPCVTGYIGDRVGRRPVFLVALFLSIVSGIANIFSRTLFMFTVMRFVSAASLVTLVIMASVLLFEVTETKFRVVCCAIATACSNMLVQLFRLLLIAVTRHWMVAQAIIMVPTSVLFLLASLLEESPCWLLAIGDVEGTERVVLSAARMNGVPLEDVKAKMNKIKYELYRRGRITTVAMGSDVLDLVFNASLRGRTIVITVCWFIVFLHYVDILSSKTLTENVTAQSIYIVLRIPVLTAFMFALHHQSRRRLLCITMIHMSVVVGFQAWLALQKDEGILTVVTVVLEAVVMDALIMTTFVYNIEIFPTVLRATGLSLGLMFARLGGMLTPFIKQPMPSVDRALVLAVSSVAFIFIGLAVLQLPETTQIKASNTVREAELEDKWQMHSPSEMAHFTSRSLPPRTTMSFDAWKKS